MLPGGSLVRVLERGAELVSTSGFYSFVHHTNGNVTLWEMSARPTALWHSRTWNQPSTQLVMQPDGNLVLYGRGGPLFATGTWGNPGAYGSLQDDGALVIYTADHVPLWSTNSWRWASRRSRQIAI